MYERVLHLLKVPVQPLAIKALIHFLDPKYHCLTFGDVDMVPIIEEYDVLTDFSRYVHKV
jgi:hypothetical protein